MVLDIEDVFESNDKTGKNEYPGVAELVPRHIWERRTHHPRPEKPKPGKPCNTGVCGILPGHQTGPKNGFDHRIDHRQENL